MQYINPGPLCIVLAVNCRLSANAKFGLQRASVTYVWRKLEYASNIWNPYLKTVILES